MRILVTIMFCSHFFSLSAQENPFANIQYDSLVIYDLNYKYKEDNQWKRLKSIVNENEVLIEGCIKKSSRLSKDESSVFTQKIGMKSSYGLTSASCFDPHFGAVYFKDGKPNAHITICLSCNTYKTSHNIPASQQGPKDLDGEIYYMKTGFSMSFRKYLNDLKKSSGFHSLQELDHPTFHVDY